MTMKKFLTLASIAISLAAVGEQPATPASVSRHYVIVLASSLPQGQGTEILKASFDLALNRARPGDRIEFLHAHELTRLAMVQVPEGSARDRANSSEFAGKFGALKKFLTEPTLGDARLAGQVRVPQLLDYVAHARADGEAVTVLVVGSPLFRTLQANEVAFNMEQGLIPGDGMITASRTQSLFGTAERKGQLRGVTVHWLTTDDRWSVSEMHRIAVQRFWSLFNSEQGAVLCSMTSDVASAFEATTRIDNRALMAVSPDPNDRGLVMRPPPAFRRETIPAPPAPTINSATAPTPRPTVPAPVPKAPEPPVVPTASQPPAPPPPKPSAKMEVPKPVLVTLDVSVVDHGNRPVVDLEKADFSVFENGVRQEVAFFTRERTPISLGLVIDTSGSIGGKLKRIVAAASSIIRQCQAQDEFFLMEFKMNATIVQDFTSDSVAVENAFGRLSASGQTALLDAVKLAVDHSQAKGKHHRKAVVLVTDGDERDSKCNREELLQSLRTANVQLYAMGFPDGLNASGTTSQRGSVPAKSEETESRAKNLLDELARVSGGRVFYPQQVAELDGIAGVISQELRTQYRLGYYATHNDRDDRWRDVRVEVGPNQAHKGVTARTRAGYFAPESP